MPWHIDCIELEDLHLAALAAGVSVEVYVCEGVRAELLRAMSEREKSLKLKEAKTRKWKAQHEAMRDRRADLVAEFLKDVREHGGHNTSKAQREARAYAEKKMRSEAAAGLLKPLVKQWEEKIDLYANRARAVA